MFTKATSRQPKALHQEISRIFNTINSNTSGNFIQTLLVYTMHVLNVEDNFIVEVAKKLNPDMKEKVLSTYEKMELRCRNEGIEKGIERNSKEVVLRGHKNGISIKDLAIITSMSEERVTEIIKQNASGIKPQ